MSDSEQYSLFADNPEYDAFVDKFKPKKTTDDCYTPQIVFDAIAGWVEKEYSVSKQNFVRPFWPDSDFQKYDYKSADIVVDNPPFSIFAKILQWYTDKGIKYFLFGPALTLFSRGNIKDCCYIPVGADVQYENGAIVKTSFVTSLDSWRIRSAPDLYQIIKKANTQNVKFQKKELPKYSYPDNVVTAAMVQQYSIHGVDFRVAQNECVKCNELDSQKAVGKSLFGRISAFRAGSSRAGSGRAGSGT